MFCLFSVGQAQTTEAPVQLPSNARTSREWIKYSDTPGRFTMMMPISPVKSEQPVETDSGKLINHLFLATTSTAAFLISYVDHPVKEDPQKILERVRDGAVNGIKGTLLRSTNITHKGYPGFEFAASVADAVYTSRIYLVNDRLYQIVVVGPPGTKMSEDINRYMASFDLKMDK